MNIEEMRQRAVDGLAIAEKATRGPWRQWMTDGRKVLREDDGEMVASFAGQGRVENEHNANFAADARVRAPDAYRDVIALAGEVERLKKAVDELVDVGERATIQRDKAEQEVASLKATILLDRKRSLADWLNALPSKQFSLNDGAEYVKRDIERLMHHQGLADELQSAEALVMNAHREIDLLTEQRDALEKERDALANVIDRAAKAIGADCAELGLVGAIEALIAEHNSMRQTVCSHEKNIDHWEEENKRHHDGLNRIWRELPADAADLGLIEGIKRCVRRGDVLYAENQDLKAEVARLTELVDNIRRDDQLLVRKLASTQ